MPGITRYNLVDDAQDLRIPMHNEAAFQHGVCFEAKYIGSLEVGRPNSRMEIVAAMRRIRYEFKLKNMKKKKVNIIVSADGVRVVLRKKKKRKEWSWDDNTVMITQDPIYRIFYVSHDAQELKIFSYIARDGQSNMFRCNVFKSKRKSQAMRIVRTVGQAFDVCHQLTLQQTGEQSSEDGLDTNAADADGEDAVPAKTRLALSDSTDLEATTEESIDCLSSDLDKTKSQELLSKDGKDPALQLTSPRTGPSVSDLLAVDSPRSVEHQVQLLQRLLQQQEQQAQAAAAQTCVLQEQLSVEVRARTDAQARVQRLLLQNTDLLQHISLLVKQIQELELKAAGGLRSMGSQDSLLEITFRAKPPLRDAHTTQTSMGPQQGQPQINNGPWASTLTGSSPPGTRAPESLSLGPGGSAVRLECFRFPRRGGEEPHQNQDQEGESPSSGGPDGDSPVGGEEVLGALEFLRFRESGIGSEYESNTDESSDRDSWGQGEGAGPEGAARLFNVLNAESPSDCLDDEMAV
ncbi:carboxyl-terminal PDZ ligand of neuronal nitric oxide synthase protein-like [Salvelinus fontinalis]|uniref:carboxyl-terminal PDZ ligand of neuronal nitric oxide synthase protein-like n=1 Tax=Salvelinus fontinalis TaxID=8038 RepID=UPI00248584ED|nr:carboxyl-terminal PDZ ligand of neuronal nitric oxide synthase protein-like [Salvelinus fontinalis]